MQRNVEVMWLLSNRRCRAMDRSSGRAHHWAFDAGLFSVTPNYAYAVLVSPVVQRVPMGSHKFEMAGESERQTITNKNARPRSRVGRHAGLNFRTRCRHRLCENREGRTAGLSTCESVGALVTVGVPAGITASSNAPAMIGLLPCLFVYLAPYRERQGFPFGRREYVPKLCQANLIEVLIDLAC